ncbi:TetR family transcriptional regulator [Streptomyces sp. NPDC059477]|uniref:TetR family transcriptional regulator n=1 Tax=Streptomyces sp. NPDC059477 TaxID=3346847 RepID=UPI0036B01054
MPDTPAPAKTDAHATPDEGATPDEHATPDRHATPGEGATPARGTGRPPATADDRPKRRQARGERRIAQLLEAAATVFATTGYTAASTNAIAREAGVSPGTLYQFFPNKEAIAIELGERLMREMREAYSEALSPVTPQTPLEEAVGGAVDRFTAFNCQHPVFFALMHGPDVPGRMAEEHEALHATLLARVQDVLRPILPNTTPADIERVAHVCLSIYKAGLELILASEGAERDAYVTELKSVLIRYLGPLTATRENQPGTEPAAHPTP